MLWHGLPGRPCPSLNAEECIGLVSCALWRWLEARSDPYLLYALPIRLIIGAVTGPL